MQISSLLESLDDYLQTFVARNDIFEVVDLYQLTENAAGVESCWNVSVYCFIKNERNAFGGADNVWNQLTLSDCSGLTSLKFFFRKTKTNTIFPPFIIALYYFNCKVLNGK